MKTDGRRWRAVLAGVWRIMGERHLGLIAAGVAFFAMFSLFPGLAALIAVWGFWADPAVIDVQLEILAEFVPPEAFALIAAQAEALIAANQSTLRWATLLSLALALWSARAGVGAMIEGLNAIHGTASRGGLGHILAALALTLTLIGLGLVALAAVVVMPVILAIVPVGAWQGRVLALLQWTLALAVVIAGVGLLFRFGPNRPGRRPAWISPGLLLAVAAWGAASFAFAHFLAGVADYNRLYGSIGAVIALMTWFYLGAYVVLLGAALDVELERQMAEPPADAARRG